MHWTSGSCRQETCSVCGEDATHKIGEEIQWDDPNQNRHNLTTYVCCRHFCDIFGYFGHDTVITYPQSNPQTPSSKT